MPERGAGLPLARRGGVGVFAELMAELLVWAADVATQG